MDLTRERGGAPGLRIVTGSRPGDELSRRSRPRMAGDAAGFADGPVRVVLVADDPRSAEAGRAALAEAPAFTLAGLADRGEHGLREVMKARPGLLILGLSDPEEALSLVEHLAELYPATAVLLATDVSSPEVWKRALRAGVREVLAWPLDSPELSAALERFQKKQRQSSSGPRVTGEIIAVLAAKGGLGATLIASNLAVLLAGMGERRAAIVDLNLEMGDVSTFLNLRAGHSIMDLVTPEHGLDDELVESTLATHRSGLKLLAQPEDLADADRIAAGEVGQVLSRLKTMFEYVVVDMPRRFDERTLEALDLADQILLVAALDLPAIRNTRRTVEVFNRLGYGDRVRLIVNRHRSDRAAERLERSFGIPVHWHLPDDYATAVSSINAGVPAAEVGPESELARSLAALAASLGGAPGPELVAVRGRSGGGLFRRLRQSFSL